MSALEYTKKLMTFESTSCFSNVPIIDYCEETLKKLGFVTERIDYTDPSGVAKSNIIGKLGTGTGGMAYFGHTDVVPADPWLSEDHGPFEPTVVGDKLFGRGSCDMKGSVACMLAAAERFSAGDLKHPVYITCTADEEVGYLGATEVAQRSELFKEMAAGASHGIIGEPTLLEVVYAHKGTYGIVATSHGEAAHSSTKAGLNANLAMIPFLQEMKAIHDDMESDTDWHNDEFDPPTVSWNIGINDHTSAVNIKAPQSVCTVYFRPMPGGKDPEILVERARAAAEKCGIEFKTRCAAQPVYVDPKSEFIQDVMSVAGAETCKTVSYGTDGAMFTAMKHLAVFGPGDIAQAHTHDEWIALDQLEKGTDLYAKLIQHWCQ